MVRSSALVAGDGVTPLAAPTRPAASATAYRAADTASQELGAWMPLRRGPDVEWLRAREVALGRIEDLVRNDGWAAGGIQHLVDTVIGSRFKLSYRPDRYALGLDQKQAQEFRRAVQSAWRGYANDPLRYCDVERRQTMSQQFATAFRHYAVDSECIGIAVFEQRGGPFGTAFQVIHPDRLSNPMGRPNSPDLKGGVELDRNNAAVAYHFREGHPRAGVFARGAGATWTRIARETSWGRQNVLHHFEVDQAGQVRGASRLAAIVEPLKMVSQYDRTELQAAILNAILCAFIETPYDPALMAEMFEDGDPSKLQAARGAYYDEKGRPELNGLRIPILATGDKLSFHNAARPAAQFADFEAAVLRKIASALGLSYEQLSRDWSRTNYSSARAALIEVWRGFTARRDSFATNYCTPAFGVWLEEALERGIVAYPRNAPRFHMARAAYCQCKWIGPGRGWVDPKKEAEGAAIRLSLGLSTLEDEANEQGLDLEELHDQLAWEIQNMPDGILHPAQKEYASLVWNSARMSASEPTTQETGA